MIANKSRCPKPPPDLQTLTTLTPTTTYVTTYVISTTQKTQTRTTTYVTNHSSYVLRDEETTGLGLTVGSRVRSLGHCEGATKAVKGVRAATGFSPLGPAFHLFQSVSLLSRVFWGFLVHRRLLHSSHPTTALGYHRAHSTGKVTFSGFTGGLNKVVHALNGNIQYMPGDKPKPHSMLWRTSMYLPNGMTMFRYRFYGKEALWMHAMRRGQFFELDTNRSDSKTLYGIVLRAVASTGGGPGSRWPLVQAYRRCANTTGASRGLQRQTCLPNASPRGNYLGGIPPAPFPSTPLHNTQVIHTYVMKARSPERQRH